MNDEKRKTAFFFINPKERKKLQTEEYQDKVAVGVVGIKRCVAEQKNAE